MPDSLCIVERFQDFRQKPFSELDHGKVDTLCERGQGRAACGVSSAQIQQTPDKSHAVEDKMRNAGRLKLGYYPLPVEEAQNIRALLMCPAVQRGMVARPDSISDLKTINAPTLVMVGAEDTLTPLSEAELLQRNILGSRLQVIPRAGHYAVFEQHETAGKAIRGFLDGLKNW